MLATPDDIRGRARAALAAGNLVRKSFEYRGVNIDQSELAEALCALQPHPSLQLSPAVNKLNAYWVREHAITQILRNKQNLSYEEYLPGRIYTYKALFERIRETINVGSIIEVGCGSGMLLHEASAHGVTVAGIDYSISALAFANCLASEFGTRNLTLVNADALGAWLPPLTQADLVSNLGSLEHLNFEGQTKFAKFMSALSKGYVLLSVPNRKSPIYNVMEQHELSISESAWVYPDEYTQFDVDLLSIGAALGWSVVRHSFVHIASTTLTSDVKELRCIADTVRRTPNSGSPSDLIRAWLIEERSCSHEFLASQAWFEFAIFDIKRV